MYIISGILIAIINGNINGVLVGLFTAIPLRILLHIAVLMRLFVNTTTEITEI